MRTNIKMRVTPEQSKKVQEIVFANGGRWYSGSTTILHLCEKYLEVVDQQGDIILYAPARWGSCEEKSKGVDADLFIRTNGTCEEEQKQDQPQKPTPKGSGTESWREPGQETWEIVGAIVLGMISFLAILAAEKF